jgi:prefoldin alpha subunit
MPITKEEEEEFEKNSYILNQIKSNLDALFQQRDMFSAAFIEVEKAYQSLENLEGEKGKPELMVPIGGDCFINAKSDSVDKVVVGIGSNIFVEKPISEAKEVLEKRMKIINENAQKIAQNIQEMEMKANQLSQRNQEIYTKAQGDQGHDHDHEH